MTIFRLLLLFLIMSPAFLSGCVSDGDPQNVDGIEFDDDGVFRIMVIPDVPPVEVYGVGRAIIRTGFAGSKFVEDEKSRKLEVLPRSFRGAPLRIHVYFEVHPTDDGSRVEIYCPVDQLAENLEDQIEKPWEIVARDFNMENRILRAIWSEVVVRRSAEAEEVIEIPSDSADPSVE